MHNRAVPREPELPSSEDSRTRSGQHLPREGATVSDAAGAHRGSLSGLLLVFFSALLLTGAFAFPFVEARFDIEIPGWIPDVFDLHERIRDWLIDTGKIRVGDQYLLGLIRGLYGSGEFFVGSALLLFSILFPITKIVMSGVACLSSRWIGHDARRRLLRALMLTSKWSMADVFIVGMVIVFFKAEGFHYRFEARLGVYCFALSALLSGVTVLLLGRTHEAREADSDQIG